MVLLREYYCRLPLSRWLTVTWCRFTHDFQSYLNAYIFNVWYQWYFVEQNWKKDKKYNLYVSKSKWIHRKLKFENVVVLYALYFSLNLKTSYTLWAIADQVWVLSLELLLDVHLPPSFMECITLAGELLRFPCKTSW